MENKNWKYIRRNTSVFSLIDLRLIYKRDTGYDYDWDSKSYVEWLEKIIIFKESLHKKFIPWEPIKNK